MRQTNIAYVFFYISFVIVILVATFLDKSVLIYFKPLIPISLILSHVRFAKKVKVTFLSCMLALVGANIFVSIDFVTYYNFIALFITTHYVLCVALLREFISKSDIKLSKLTSPPALISIMLIMYLMFAISELALPQIKDSVIVVVIVVLSMILFVVISFFIYLTNRYEKVIFLFISACCTLFVNGLLGVNELYYYHKIFTVLINVAEGVGVYFLTRFFIETKPVDYDFLNQKHF